jgi:pimeloyl-ACP methyl ester carboxylesterase
MYLKVIKIITVSIVSIIILVIAISFIIPVSKAIENERIKVFANSYYMQVDGLDIHYRIWKNPLSENNNRWVALLHGMGGSTYSWENNAQVLCDSGFNVVAVDIPPFGYSDKDPDYNYSIENRASLIWTLLGRINRNARWNLVGHSMGGGIVQCMAIQKPEKVNKVIFVAPALFTELKPKRDFGQYLSAFPPLERIMCIAGEHIYLKPKKIQKILESSFASEVDDVVVEEYYKALDNDGFCLAFLRSFSRAKNESKVNGLDFNIKSIAFFGTKDTWVPYESIKPICDKLISIDTIIVSGAGHSLMETNYQQFNMLSIQFLKN